MINRQHELTLTRQSEILALSRSSLYYQAVPVSEQDLKLMSLIDEIHTKYPFMGSRSLKNQLRDRGHEIGRGHVRTLMQKLGITALYQKPRLSDPHPDHKIYPYLLRGLEITGSNAVWCSDITYIPMAKGFCYLVAIMDWASRRVLSWRLSNTMDTFFCKKLLKRQYSGLGHLKSSIRTKAVSSHLISSRVFSSTMESESAWMVRNAGWIMFSSNGYGEA